MQQPWLQKRREQSRHVTTVDWNSDLPALLDLVMVHWEPKKQYPILRPLAIIANEYEAAFECTLTMLFMCLDLDVRC